MNQTSLSDQEYYLRYYGGRHWSFYRSVLAEIILHAEPGPVLDLGCGTGLFLECATRWGITCEGLDGSAAAVELSMQRIAPSKIFHSVLGAPLPFPSDFYSAVVMNQVIEHLDPAATVDTLKEIFRILKPGGLFYIASPSAYNKKAWREDPTHQYLYTPQELQQLLISHGYVQIIPRNHPFALLGQSRIGLKLMYGIFKIVPWGRLSATANCLAFKP